MRMKSDIFKQFVSAEELEESSQKLKSRKILVELLEGVEEQSDIVSLSRLSINSDNLFAVLAEEKKSARQSKSAKKVKL